MTSFPLNNGYSIPGLGLGTWKLEKEQATSVILRALELGYRHIDCAAIYGNEKEVGLAFQQAFRGKDSFLTRDQIFVTGKLWNTHHRPDLVKKALNQTLENLQLDYLDLFLMHWPVAWREDAQGIEDPEEKAEDIPITETWKAMEALVYEGKVRSIGFSNFNMTRIKKIVGAAEIKPAVNQVEMHPFFPQEKLLNFCQSHDIHLTAFSPLGGRGNITLMENEVVLHVAQKLGKTPAQILLAWALQRVTSVVPKTAHEERLEENLDCQFEIPRAEFEALCKLGVGHRYLNSTDMFKVDVFKEQGQMGFVDL